MCSYPAHTSCHQKWFQPINGSMCTVMQIIWPAYIMLLCHGLIRPVSRSYLYGHRHFQCTVYNKMCFYISPFPHKKDPCWSTGGVQRVFWSLNKEVGRGPPPSGPLSRTLWHSRMLYWITSNCPSQHTSHSRLSLAPLTLQESPSSTSPAPPPSSCSCWLHSN